MCDWREARKRERQTGRAGRDRDVEIGKKMKKKRMEEEEERGGKNRERATKRYREREKCREWSGFQKEPRTEGNKKGKATKNKKRH